MAQGSRLKAQGGRICLQPSAFSLQRLSSGFTLIELLVVSVVLMVIGAALLTSFLTGQSAYLSADADIQAQEQGRKALDRIVRELREANPDPTKVTLSGDKRQLDFQIALGYNRTGVPGCTANTVCWGAQQQNGTLQAGWFIRYRVDGSATRTQLVREVLNAAKGPTGESQVLAILINGAPVAGNDNDTKFDWAPPPTNTITITLEVQNPSNRLPGGVRTFGTVTSQVRLRNP